MRAAIISALAAMGLVAATPSRAQDDVAPPVQATLDALSDVVELMTAAPTADQLAREALTCTGAALRQQSRTAAKSNKAKQARDFAAYWQEQLERAEPDAAKRESLLEKEAEEWDAGLAEVSPANRVKAVEIVLWTCTKWKELRETR